MKYMKSNQSSVLQEFGRIMEEKDGLRKNAQALPPPAWAPGTSMPGAEQMLSGPKPPAWEKLFADLESARGNPKALEAVQGHLQSMNYPASEQGYYDQALQLLQRSMAPANLQADARAKQHPSTDGAQVAKAPTMHKNQSLSARDKTAEQKTYDVTPKEDLVHEAHPVSAKVSGDVVENLNEQQDADLAVAEKSAKDVLKALYKLAKELQVEGNETAYKMVKETFLDISKTIKKS